jgi:hypothetical protein
MIRSVFGAAVGFGILSVVFGVLEYWSPAAVPAPRRSNRALMTDLLYWIFTRGPVKTARYRGRRLVVTTIDLSLGAPRRRYSPVGSTLD